MGDRGDVKCLGTDDFIDEITQDLPPRKKKKTINPLDKLRALKSNEIECQSRSSDSRIPELSALPEENLSEPLEIISEVNSDQNAKASFPSFPVPTVEDKQTTKDDSRYQITNLTPANGPASMQGKHIQISSRPSLYATNFNNRGPLQPTITTTHMNVNGSARRAVIMGKPIEPQTISIRQSSIPLSRHTVQNCPFSQCPYAIPYKKLLFDYAQIVNHVSFVKKEMEDQNQLITIVNKQSDSIQNLQKKLDEIKSEKKDLNDSFCKLFKENRNLEKILTESKTKLFTVERENERIYEKLKCFEDSQDEIQSLKMTNQMLNDKVKDMDEKIVKCQPTYTAKLEDQVNQLKNQLRNSKQEIVDMKDSCDYTDLRNKNLEKQKAELEDKIFRLERSNKRYKSISKDGKVEDETPDTIKKPRCPSPEYHPDRAISKAVKELGKSLPKQTISHIIDDVENGPAIRQPGRKRTAPVSPRKSNKNAKSSISSTDKELEIDEQNTEKDVTAEIIDLDRFIDEEQGSSCNQSLSKSNGQKSPKRQKSVIITPYPGSTLDEPFLPDSESDVEPVKKRRIENHSKTRNTNSETSDVSTFSMNQDIEHVMGNVSDSFVKDVELNVKTSQPRMATRRSKRISEASSAVSSGTDIDYRPNRVTKMNESSSSAVAEPELNTLTSQNSGS